MPSLFSFTDLRSVVRVGERVWIVDLWLILSFSVLQLLCAKCLHYRIYTFPPRHRCPPLSLQTPNRSSRTSLPRPSRLVTSSRCQYPRWKRRSQEQSRHCGVPSLRLLPYARMFVLHQLGPQIGGNWRWMCDDIDSKAWLSLTCKQQPQLVQLGGVGC